jgi:hypothetical protein
VAPPALRSTLIGSKKELTMKYRTVALSCACGKTPKHVSEIGLTAQHEIVFHWRCSRCHTEMYFVRPLSDCYRDCPSSRQDVLAPPDKMPSPTNSMASIDDRRFLRMLGVRDPDEIE